MSDDYKEKLKALRAKQEQGLKKTKVTEDEDIESDDLEDDGDIEEDEDEEDQEEFEDDEPEEKTVKPFKPKVTEQQKKAHKAIDDFDAKEKEDLQKAQLELVENEKALLHNNGLFRFRLIGILTLINENLKQINDSLNKAN